MLVGIAIDAFATKGLADLWATASATDKATAFRMAEVQNALFQTWAALFIGLLFLVLSVSGLLARGWLPALAWGERSDRRSRCTRHGRLRLPARVRTRGLFNVFAFLVTVWALVAGMLVWRAPAHQLSAPLEAASAA